MEQISERIARRWRVFGYENALLSSEGAGLRTGLGVLEELLSPSKCWGNNADCEDGADIRDGGLCPRCEEHRQDQRTPAAADLGTPGHPEVAEPEETYTPPAYVPHPRESSVGVNEALARDARAGILAAKSMVKR
ncbi:hypothetical protein [Streptomyces sp. NPDC018584]|uniref:hypothetical protein n=1 Tax=unclassified Streptomyces TaxID=2593676 RepID=UPI00379B475D